MAKLSWVMSHVGEDAVRANVLTSYKNFSGEDVETGEDVTCSSDGVKAAAIALENAVRTELGIVD